MDKKKLLNQALRPVGLKIDSLTLERSETGRIQQLRRQGHFDGPAYPLLPGFAEFKTDALVEALDAHQSDIQKLMRGGAAPGGYDPTNDFFKSADAAVLYLMVRMLKPRRIVEVGCGNSTRIIRQAIADGALSVEHIAIDPSPRSDIAGLVDKMLLTRLEEAAAREMIASLAANDILFIDSSHEVSVGNDVAELFCVALPSLVEGVAVHVHDIFLPYDYPEPFCTTCPRWGEQYLVQILLQEGRHEILWPGYYLQKQRPDAIDRLPFLRGDPAQSLWFKVRSRRNVSLQA